MFEKIRKKKPKGRLFRRFSAVGAALSLILSFDVFSATVEPGEEGPSRFKAMGVVIPSPAPDRMDTEGDGPFDRLVVENVMLVNGLGAPPRGPVSIVISGDTIAQFTSL